MIKVQRSMLNYRGLKLETGNSKEGIKRSVKMETWKYENNEPRRRETLNVKRLTKYASRDTNNKPRIIEKPAY